MLGLLRCLMMEGREGGASASEQVTGYPGILEGAEVE